MVENIRWQQRFNNYQKALSQLSKFIQTKNLNELEEQGLIQSFEYTHELAWKTLADFIKNSGNVEIYGSKDATREAFNLGLISNGAVWMNMIISRNMTSHSYNEETTIKIISGIKNDYYQEFQKLEKKFLKLL